MACILVWSARDYFFDRRLVCLNGNRCAIAWVQTIEADADGDRALNTILAPANDKTSEADYKTMFQANTLVYVDPGLGVRGWHLDPKDNRRGVNPATFGSGQLPFFHCEIEGTYFDEWTTALLAYLLTLILIALVALILATTAAALGPIGWVICIAVFLILVVLFLLGFAGPSPDVGQADAGPIGDSTPGPNGPVVTDSGGNSINVGDRIALIGRHICDTAHHDVGGCWNELHPVLGVTKVHHAVFVDDYDSAPWNHTNGDIYDKYCAALQGFVDRKRPITHLTYLEHPSIG